MWIWILIGAIVIGAIIGFLNSDSGNAKEDATQGALMGGCLAASCLVRIGIAALIIFAIIWLFGFLFG